MYGAMGTQADKAPEALDAFVEIMDGMPMSPERFAGAKEFLIESFRSSPLGFREVLGAVRSWERLGVPVDPRRRRYEAVLAADIEDMLAFYREVIAGRPKLIAIAGDASKIDMERVNTVAPAQRVELGQIFVD
jgi:hypothetical protein